MIPASPDVFCDFADGTSARLHRIAVNLEQGRLRLIMADGNTLFWPFETLRQLPDQADQDNLTLFSIDDPLARLYLRDARLKTIITEQAGSLTRRPPVENKGRLFKWGVAAIASVALIVFVLVPIMADQLARYLPPEGEKALGDTTFEQIRRALDDTGLAPLGLCEDAAGVAALQKILTRLNPDDDLPYPIEVAVLNHGMINAFALPGGRIAFFRGLIDAANSPEEVAAVFAHEIGHVVNRDPTRDALRSAGSIGVLGLLFGDFAGGTVVLFLANRLVNASYSQTAEAGADTFAHALMKNANLSPAALGTMFQRLKETHGEEDGFVAHFAAHPLLTDRINASLAATEGMGETTPLLTQGEWSDLQGICGAVRATSLNNVDIKEK